MRKHTARQILGLPDRFWVKTSIEDRGFETPCVVWTGTKNNYGYGQFKVNKRRVSAHRLAYETIVGQIPEGLQIDHLCRVRNCVNPTHLEPVTRRVNILRGDSPSAKNAVKTHCVNGHPFNEANTYVTRDGRRSCRACSRDYQNKRYADDPDFAERKRVRSRVNHESKRASLKEASNA